MVYESYPSLRVGVESAVAELVINHPPINLIDRKLFRQLRHVSRELERDDDVSVVIVTSGLEGFFLAHFDVEMIREFPQRVPRPTSLNAWHVLCERMRLSPKTSIAMIEGRTGGAGAELAIACDMRFAALESAMFCQPETGMGLMALGGGTQHLPRLMGRSRALEVLLGADDFDAVQAERYNWVNRSLPAAQLRPFVWDLARRIASFPQEAVAATKAAVLRTQHDVPSGLLEDQIVEAEFRREACRAERIERFLARGGQTPEAEQHLAALLAPNATSGC